MTPVIKTSKILIVFNIIATNARQVLQPLSSAQRKQPPVKPTISAFATWCSTSLEAILHNQVSARASEVTEESLCQFLTLIYLYLVQILSPIFVDSNSLPKNFNIIESIGQFRWFSYVAELNRLPRRKTCSWMGFPRIILPFMWWTSNPLCPRAIKDWFQNTREINH